MKYFFGIDLGGTNIAMGILDEHYQLVAKKSIPTLANQGFSQVVARIATQAQSFAMEQGIFPLACAGVGVPGTIDPTTHRIIFANNLGWVDVDFIGEFQKHWNIPLTIANDCNCALLGEWQVGSGRGCQDIMMLTLGTGVGGGLVLQNQLYLGGNGLGCELGHTLFCKDGLPCNCGRSGCLEMYLSVTALKEQTKQAMAHHPESIMHQIVRENNHKISGKTAFQAKAMGDAAGTYVVECYIDYLSQGIISLFSILRPPLIIIGGAISKEGDNLLAPIQMRIGDVIRKTDFMEPPRLVPAQLGGDAGIIGSALLPMMDCSHKNMRG